jgi:hypothetical protein
MATVSPPFPRERTIRWEDPRALAEAGRAMSGRDFLDAVLRGTLPDARGKLFAQASTTCLIVDVSY